MYPTYRAVGFFVLTCSNSPMIGLKNQFTNLLTSVSDSRPQNQILGQKCWVDLNSRSNIQACSHQGSNSRKHFPRKKACTPYSMNSLFGELFYTLYSSTWTEKYSVQLYRDRTYVYCTTYTPSPGNKKNSDRPSYSRFLNMNRQD